MADNKLNLKLIVDILASPGKINTSKLEKAILGAFNRMPNFQNLANEKLRTKDVAPSILGDEFQKITKEAKAFQSALREVEKDSTKSIRGILGKSNRFRNLLASDAQHVDNIAKSFAKIESIFRADQGSRFFSDGQKKFRFLNADIQRIIKDPNSVLKIADSISGKGGSQRIEALREFAKYQKNILTQAKQIESSLIATGTKPEDLPAFANFIADTERRLKSLKPVDDLEQIRAREDARKRREAAARADKARKEQVAAEKKKQEEQAKLIAEGRKQQAATNAASDKADEARALKRAKNESALLKQQIEERIAQQTKAKNDAIKTVNEEAKAILKAHKDRIAAENTLQQKHDKFVARRQRILRERAASELRRTTAKSLLEQYGGVGEVGAIPRGQLKSIQAGLKEEEKYQLGRLQRIQAVQQKLQQQSLQFSKGEGFRTSDPLSGDRFRSLQLGAEKARDAATQAGTAADKAAGSLSKFGTFAQQAGALIRQFFRFAIGYGALYQALNAVLGLSRAISGLNKELTSIKAITQATDKEMQTIEATISNVALTTQFTTDQIAKAARILGQAGVEAQEFPTALAAVAQFAGATESSLELAADLLTTFRNVFKELDDVTISDQLTKAINISKLTADDLKTIASISAQTAARYEIGSDQYLGAASVLRDAGIKASTIATGLRRASNELFSLDKKSLDAFKQRYEEIGEFLSEEQIKARFFGYVQSENPLLNALRELQRIGFAGSGKQELARVFDIRAVNVISALINNLDELAAAEAKITFGSAAAEGAQTQLESLSNSLDNLGAAFTVFGTSISENGVGVMEDFVDSITDALTALADFNSELKAGGDSSLGEAILPAILGGVGAFSLSKSGLFGKIGAGFLGAGVVGGGVTALESAGADSSADAVTGILGGILAGQVLGGLASSTLKGGKEYLTNLGEKIKTLKIDNKIQTGTGSIAKLKEYSAILLAAVKQFGPFKVVAVIGTALAGLVAVLSSQKSSYDQLVSQLNQRQRNLQREEARTRQIIDQANEFDTEAPKPGTAGETIKSLVTSSLDVIVKINKLFDSQATDLREADKALDAYVRSTKGDAGSVNAARALEALRKKGFTGTADDAASLGTQNIDTKKTIQAVAGQFFEQFRRVQDRLVSASGDLGQLSVRDQNFYKAFQEIVKTSEGLATFNNLKYPEAADVQDLRTAIVELSKAITEQGRESADEARAELDKQRLEASKALEAALAATDPKNVQQIERLINNFLSVDPTKGAAGVIEARQDLQKLLDKFAQRAANPENANLDKATGFFGGLLDDASVKLKTFDFAIKAATVSLKKYAASNTDTFLGGLFGLFGGDGEKAIAEGTAAAVAGAVNKGELAKLDPVKEQERLRKVQRSQDNLNAFQALQSNEFAQRLLKAIDEKNPTRALQLKRAGNLTASELQDNPELDKALAKFVLEVEQRTEVVAATKKQLEKQVDLYKKQSDILEQLITIEETSADSVLDLNDLNKKLFKAREKSLIAEFKKRTIGGEESPAEAQQALLASQRKRVGDKTLSLENKRNDLAQSEIDISRRIINIRNRQEKGEQSLEAGIQKLRRSIYGDKRSEATQKREQFNEGLAELNRQRREEFQKEQFANEDVKRAAEYLAKGNLELAIKNAESAMSLAEGLSNNFASYYLADQAGRVLLEAKKQQVDREEDAVSLEKQLEGTITNLRELQALAGEVNSTEISPKLKLETEEATQSLQEIGIMMDSLNRSVTVRINYVTSDVPTPEVEESAAPQEKRARGGSIPGYGGGDTVRALLERGEEVIRKERAAPFRDVLKFINNAPLSAVQAAFSGGKFRLGGTVSGHSAASGGSGGGSVIIQLPSGQQTPPLYGSNQAITAVQKMVFNEAGKIVRRRRV